MRNQDQSFLPKMESVTKKDIVKFLFSKGILVTPELLEKINSHDDLEQLHSDLITKEDPESYLLNYEQQQEKPIVTQTSTSVNVISSYEEESQKRTVQDFVDYFNKRYKAFEALLRNRQELQNIMSINRLLNKKDKETVALIGLVKEKSITQSGGIMLELEDPTGVIKVFINKNKKDLFEPASDIVLDEVIGVVGGNGDKIVFANNIIWPDIPMSKELKKAPDDIYAIFLSDIHVGSHMFLEKEFNQFLDWINCKVGNDKQKEIASKIQYVFIVGDLIDGLGIYPGQESELTIKEISKQYEECAKYLNKIPKHIKIIICAGNHDGMRIAEPQPLFYKDFAASLWEIENATLVSNPGLVNIHSSENFPGFDVLLYHGYSFDYYVANVDSIRNNDGYNRADLIMKFLLQRRHLAPTYSSTLYIPDKNQDPLIIDKIPDIFVTGHIHKSIAANYRNITTICGSCWQAKTPFQEKVGHNPEPARVPLVNLKTREIKILKFTND